MKSLQKNISALLIFAPIIALADSDPFENHTWYRDNNSLTTRTHSPIFGSDHSLSYVLPDGLHSSTDLCNVTAPNHLECNTGDKVTFDPNTYSVSLTSPHGSATYYDPAHPPKISPISGNWHDIGQQGSGWDFGCPGLSIEIPSQEYGATTFSNITIRDSGGYSTLNTFYLFKYSDGIIYFAQNPSNLYMGWSFFLVDANDAPITDLNKVDGVLKLNNFFYKSCILMKK